MPLKHDVSDRIANLTNQAEGTTFSNLIQDLEGEMYARFLTVKDVVEDWQDAITNEAALITRLKNIADNASYTKRNLIDMMLICSFLWNIE